MLNPEQQQVVEHVDGPLLVLAGAGSGKTHALVQRIVSLIQDHKVPQDRILSVTFSKKAAMEMNDRAAKLGVKDARIGTWHSLAMSILREDDLLAGWTVDSGGKEERVLKDVIGYRGLNWKDADAKALRGFISYARASYWRPDDTNTFELAQSSFARDARKAVAAYRMLEQELRQRRLLVFDNMLVYCLDHLRDSNNVAEKWRSRWDYLLQDEAQDANPVQMMIAELLAHNHHNYMVVGDPAQSIYSWRGSSPSYLTNFSKQWDDTKVVTMNRNYRSSSDIIDAANNVMARMPSSSRLPEDLKGNKKDSGIIEFHTPISLDQEAEIVVSGIRHDVKNGGKYSDSAILFRTNAQSRSLEEELIKHSIPYQILGAQNFYERREIKALLSYLRTGVDYRIDEYRRCINAPFRFIGAKTLGKIDDALAGGNSLNDVLAAIQEASYAVTRRQRESLEFVSKLFVDIDQRDSDSESPGEILEWLVDKIGYLDWLVKDQGEESLDTSHVANVKELIRVAKKFESTTSFLAFIDLMIKKSQMARSDRRPEKVLLMTVHRSKGLEWPSVYIVGVAEKIFPHARADLEEERRLFYVAITRAESSCCITSPQTMAGKTGVMSLDVSRFVEEAGINE